MTAEQSSQETEFEVPSSQPASEFLHCNGDLKQDGQSSLTESATDFVLVNENNPDSLGNSTTAESANTAEHNSSRLQYWQKKYPGRKIKPHSCSTCGKLFLQSVQLRKHMIKHASADDENSMEFPYTCCICQRHFLFANDLHRHLISHSSDRPFSCMICTRLFKRDDDLTKHMKTHTGIQPYHCTECSEELGSASKLRGHMRKVHRVHECTSCHVRFATRSQLGRHKREQHAGLYSVFLSQLIYRVVQNSLYACFLLHL